MPCYAWAFIHCTKACCAVRAMWCDPLVTLTSLWAVWQTTWMTKAKWSNIENLIWQKQVYCSIGKSWVKDCKLYFFEKAVDEAMYRPNEGCVNTCSRWAEAVYCPDLVCTMGLVYFLESGNFKSFLVFLFVFENGHTFDTDKFTSKVISDSLKKYSFIIKLVGKFAVSCLLEIVFVLW